MNPPAPVRRERLVGMLLLGIALVLLASSPTWFASDQALVGVAQVFLALVVAAVGVWLYRRAQAAGLPPRHRAPLAGPGGAAGPLFHGRHVGHSTADVDGRRSREDR